MFHLETFILFGRTLLEIAKPSEGDPSGKPQRLRQWIADHPNLPAADVMERLA